MLLAMRLSARRGWIAAGEVDDFAHLLRSMNLPVSPPADMGPEQFLDLMSHDKKVVDGRLRLVLLRAVGEACIVDDAGTAELSALLQGAD